MVGLNLKPFSSLGTLFQLLRKMHFRLGQFFWPLIGSLLGGGFELLSCLMAIPVIQFLVSAEKDPLVKQLWICLCFSFLMRAVFVYLSQERVAALQRSFHEALRNRVFISFLKIDRNELNQIETGKLQSIVISFVSDAAFSIQYSYVCLTQAIFFSAYFAFLIYLSPKATLAASIASSVFLIPTRRMIRNIQTHSKEKRTSLSDLIQRISEAVGQLTLIKLSQTEIQEFETFKALNQKAAQACHEIDLSQVRLRLLQEITAPFIFCGLLGLAIFYGPARLSVSPTYFVLYCAALLRLIQTGNQIAYSLGQLASTHDQMQTVSKLFEKLPAEETRANLSLAKLRSSISIRNLNFEYLPDRPVLTDVSLDIPYSKVTAIVGHSGSGKSTILRLLLKLQEVPPSTIFWDGIDINHLDTTLVRKHISVVSQEIWLFNDTIRNNLTYGVSQDFTDKELFDSLKKVELDDLVYKLPLQLDTLIGERGIKLSGGERQRLSIARAWLKDAEILILDEATSSIDTLTEQKINASLAAHQKQRTTIVVAHRLSTIMSADQIIVLAHGRVIEKGPPKELFSHGGYFTSMIANQGLHFA